MNVLRPFPGRVVDPAWADRVTTGPYDAYSPTQRAAIAEANDDADDFYAVQQQLGASNREALRLRGEGAL